MASYYYLLSSLPMLKPDSPVPFSYQEFLAMCKNAVSSSRYNQLQDLTPASTEGPLIAQWATFYTALTKELAYQRKKQLGQKAQPVYPQDEQLSRAVTAAIKEANPLKGEYALLALQFEKVDQLIGTHYFDDYALMGYALKLKLLERKNIFDPQRGRAELERIVDAVQRQITTTKQE